MPDLARGFPSTNLPPPDQAKAAYQAMSPEDRKLVDMHAERLKAKGDKRYNARAVAIVQNMAADVGSDDSPEVPDTEPTTGEAIGAGIMGIGRAGLDVLGAQRVSNAKAEDDPSLAGRVEHSMDEAAATAPGAFANGRGAMDAFGAVANAGHAASRIAEEGLTSGAVGDAMAQLKAALGGSGMKAADVLEEVPAAGKMFAKMRKVFANAPGSSSTVAQGMGGMGDTWQPPAASIDASGQVIKPFDPVTAVNPPDRMEALRAALAEGDVLTPSQAGAVEDLPDLPVPPRGSAIGRKDLAAIDESDLPSGEKNAEILARMQGPPEPAQGPSTSSMRTPVPKAKPSPPPGTDLSAPPPDDRMKMLEQQLRGPGSEMPSMSEIRRMIPTPEPIPFKPIGPAAPQMPAAAGGTESIKAAVADGVARGVPLRELAAELGLNQGDIAAYYKAAQLGFLH